METELNKLVWKGLTHGCGSVVFFIDLRSICDHACVSMY